MKRTKKLFMYTIAVTGMLTAGAAAAQTPRVVAITADDQMKYSVPQIVAKPGESLRIRLTATSVAPKVAMAHNFVLLRPDTKINDFVMAAAMAREADYIPAAFTKQILAKTGLAGGGETVEVTFVVPKTPGKYPYVCSFAGHYQAGMSGWLIVK